MGLFPAMNSPVVLAGSALVAPRPARSSPATPRGASWKGKTMRVKDETQGCWKGYCRKRGLGLIILLCLIGGMAVSSPLIVREGVNGVIVGIAGTLTVLFTFGGKMLKEYLQFNIKGHLYVVWYDPEGGCIRDELFSNSGKHLAGNEEYLHRSIHGVPVSNYASYPCIWVSLGGWLADFSADCYQGHGNPSSHWAVSVAKIGVTSLRVTLTDAEGQSLTMDICRMLQLFCTRSDQVAYWPQRVEELVITLAEDRDRLLECLASERDSVEKRTRTLERLGEDLKVATDKAAEDKKKFDFLVNEALEALEQLTDARVFGRSKGAPAIRMKLINVLLQTLDVSDGRRQHVLAIDSLRKSLEPKPGSRSVAAQV